MTNSVVPSRQPLVGDHPAVDPGEEAVSDER
ncbi:hypothetical protein BKA25_003353 [Actinoalloteichus hymeniacidonis]|nr:hypothetical protein [Actinoalloteichus hymeniacidonis]